MLIQPIKWEMRAEHIWQADRIALYLAVNMQQGKRMLAREPELVAWPDGESPAPMLTLNKTEAQHLVDELWRAGVRPTEAAGSVGALSAVERHLQDMRSITGGLLKTHGVEMPTRR